jgi:hypothetical protein
MFSYQPENLDCAYPVIKETVPQSALGYHSNNKYDNFPPLMSDGRSITNTWQPESTINADLLKSTGIQTNWQYRNFLIHHAKDIMEYNFHEASNDVGYYKRPLEVDVDHRNKVKDMNNTPYLYKSVTDETRPKGFVSSDLKDIYLTREQLEARKISPVITQDQLLRMNQH